MAETNTPFPTSTELRNRGEIYMESQSQISQLIAGRLVCFASNLDAGKVVRSLSNLPDFGWGMADVTLLFDHNLSHVWYLCTE